MVRLFRFDSYTRLADFSQFTNSVGLRILILVPDGAAAICPGRSFACLAISYDGAVIIIANGMSADSVIFAVRMNLCLDIVEQAKQPWGMVKLFNEGGFGEP